MRAVDERHARDAAATRRDDAPGDDRAVAPEATTSRVRPRPEARHAVRRRARQRAAAVERARGPAGGGEPDERGAERGRGSGAVRDATAAALARTVNATLVPALPARLATRTVKAWRRRRPLSHSGERPLRRTRPSSVHATAPSPGTVRQATSAVRGAGRPAPSRQPMAGGAAATDARGGDAATGTGAVPPRAAGRCAASARRRGGRVARPAESRRSCDVRRGRSRATAPPSTTNATPPAGWPTYVATNPPATRATCSAERASATGAATRETRARQEARGRRAAGRPPSPETLHGPMRGRESRPRASRKLHEPAAAGQPPQSSRATAT